MEKFLGNHNQNGCDESVHFQKFEDSEILETLTEGISNLSIGNFSFNLENSTNLSILNSLTINSVFYSRWSDPLLQQYLRSILLPLNISETVYPNIFSFLNENSNQLTF
ncbi:hypothetical protein RF11_12669 [Thelohanellus kitauei]|uniref:Uncharacterized protein n=1 Tax=Thelohanellus kitauei TaxID=669202 RepID=A0A0C2MRB2_THEKT|nr:hypothetical protein RF11_12669 [Thelohanellus kitauei]